MKVVAWMMGGSVGAWLVAAAFVERTSAIALFFGMLAPLVMSCVTWVLAGRTYERSPQALTGLMVAAFAFKMVFYGGYVAVMLRILHLRPVPFVISFSSFFIALHFVEGLLLRRLFASDPRA